MRPLIDLSNEDKIRYLHQLLPNDIPALISCIESTAEYILKNEKEIKDKWQSTTISFDEWLTLAEQAAYAIKTFRPHLIANAAFFSTEIFPEYMSLFSFYCLQEYVNISPNQQFLDGVKFFFDLKQEKRI